MKGQVARIGRLWRTVRWLKAEQVIWRIRLRLPYRQPDLRPAPPRRVALGTWVAPAAREPSLVGPTCMRLLNEEHDLSEVGWDDPAVALLWRYNQHYFDDLNSLAGESRRAWQRALVQRWSNENPPGRGTGWASFPTSLRIVNWVKWWLSGEPASRASMQSLAVQARWLMRRIEWHLLGNHLFANAKALMFAGLVFEGAEASAWLDEGLRILRRELPEQILADGGQFERSPMYHALALEDVLDLVNVISTLAPIDSPARRLLPQLCASASAMLHWMRCLRHPGGVLARFNDCADGVAPPTDDLERYARELGITAAPAGDDGIHRLEPSGYVRASRGAAVALLDVAPIGPDYLPGHAHADTLSFELSIAGRELVVNRGTSVYGDGARRQWERSTAAHSTVQVGEHDSSEVWAAFRVGRRARPGPVQIAGWVLDASHNGYTHLAGAPRHHRRWRFDANAMLVEDCIDPPSSQPAVACFHFAPGLSLECAEPQVWRICDGKVEFVRVHVLVGSGEQLTTQHAPRFGLLVEADTLFVRLSGGRATVRFAWST